jgi:hypothetical protein
MEAHAMGKLELYAEALAILNFVDRQRFEETTVSENMVTSTIIYRSWPSGTTMIR